MQKHDPMLIEIQPDEGPTNLSECGPLYSVDQVRSIDNNIIEQLGVSGLELMRLAAEASIDAMIKNWPHAKQFRVYCGSGNNAADGYILAGLLAQRRLRVEVIEVGGTKKLTSDGEAAHRFCSQTQAVLSSTETSRQNEPDSDSKFDIAPDVTSDTAPDVVVDALLGTGTRGAPRSEYIEAINDINDTNCPVVALDLPSGLSADTGYVSNVAVMADVTVTFIGLKRGLFTAKGKDHCGKLYLAKLVEMDQAPEFAETVKLLDVDLLRSQFPKRKKDAHKYDFGHVVIVGGDIGMSGAVVMTALAAMRSGAGLVTVVTHPDHAAQIAAQHPELMVRGVNAEGLMSLFEKASVLAVGPGLGQSDWSGSMFEAAIHSELPIILDADGLNHLASKPQRRDNWVLTPHPGEAGRLLDSTLVQRDRFSSAAELQNRYGGVVVLKGAGTILATELRKTDQENDANPLDENHQNPLALSLCPYGNPGMSTAGMGDVLCGVIAGLYAQTSDSLLSAELGVALHSAAADRCVAREGIRGLMATDLVPAIRRLLNDV